MSSEFVGRTGALRLYSYPKPRFTGLVGPFANNFAAGPETDTVIPTGVGILIPWSQIWSGAPDGTNVPITPKSTGSILVSGVLVIKNNDSSNQRVDIQVLVNGVPFTDPLLEQHTIPPVSFAAIPILARLQPGDELPLGVAANIRILLASTDDTTVSLVALDSTLSVQEMALATG